MKTLLINTIVIVGCLTSGSASTEPFTAGLTALSREHATTAYRAWLKVAEKGDAEGQNNVGFLYERGLGVSQDYKQAEAWYMMASAQGLPSARGGAARGHRERAGRHVRAAAALPWYSPLIYGLHRGPA